MPNLGNGFNPGASDGATEALPTDRCGTPYDGIFGNDIGVEVYRNAGAVEILDVVDHKRIDPGAPGCIASPMRQCAADCAVDCAADCASEELKTA